MKKVITACILLVCTIQFLPTSNGQDLVPVETIPIQISLPNEKSSFIIKGDQGKDIVWVWIEEEFRRTRFSFKRINQLFEITQEFSRVIPKFGTMFFEKEFSDGLNNTRKLIFSLVSGGVLILTVDFDKKQISYEQVGESREIEYYGGEYTSKEKYYYFTYPRAKRNQIKIYEFNKDGERIHHFNITEINSLLDEVTLYSPDLLTTLVPEDGLKSMFIISPSRKLYFNDGKFYFTYNPRHVMGGQLIHYVVALDLTNDTYTLDQTTGPYIHVDNEFDGNAFLHDKKLFIVAANAKELKIRIHSTERTLPVLKEWTINKADVFPFPKSEIVKASIPLTSNKKATLTSEQNWISLIRKMGRNRAVITVGNREDGHYIITIGSYRLIVGTNPYMKHHFFQGVIDSKTLEIKDHAVLLKPLHDQAGPVATSLLMNMATSALDDLPFQVRLQEYKKHIIDHIQHTKPYFKPLLPFTFIMNDEVHYGFYRRDKKEVQIYNLQLKKE